MMAFTRCANRYCNVLVDGSYLQVRGEVYCCRACQQAEGRAGTVVEEDAGKGSTAAGDSIPEAHKEA